jgi:signal peptidase II
VLGVVSLLVSLGVAVWILKAGRRGLPRTRALALGLLLGGAIGNGLDRWRLGAVIDFLALVPVNFPVFNLADVAINLAVVGFLIDLFQQAPDDG